jgi:type II secretory pathway component PulM
MKAWFYGLQSRERWILAIGAAAAVLIVVWGFVVTLQDEIEILRTSVDTKQRLLIDVARVEGERPSTITRNRTGTEQTLVVIVDNTARNHGLDLPRTRANGPSGVDVSFQGASADALLAWLVVLRETYGIEVETASFSGAREPGLVTGQISLRRL